MTADVVPYRPQEDGTAVATFGRPTLDSWIAMVPHIVKWAEHISHTEFVPKSIRGNVAAVAAAMMTGREIGIPLMASLKHVRIVEGEPALSAEMGRALVWAAGHELRYVGSPTAERCVIEGRRRGEQEWTRVEWTIGDARTAGLLSPGKTGNFRKGWMNYPRRMLIARASSELCHIKFSDCLLGMSFHEEVVDEGLGEPTEVHDDAVPDTTDVVQRKAGGRGSRSGGRRETTRRPQQDAQTEPSTPPDSPLPVTGPPLPGEAGYEQPTDEAPDGDAGSRPAEIPQLKAIAAALGNHGIKDKASRLEVTAILAGKGPGGLATSAELTAADTSTVLDTIRNIERLLASPEAIAAGTTFDGLLQQMIGEFVGRRTEADPTTGEIAETQQEGESQP